MCTWLQDKYTYPFYPIKGKEYKVEEELCIDLANEGVPDQATEVIVYAMIKHDDVLEELTSAIRALSSSIDGKEAAFSLLRREVKLIVSTKSPNGVIKRKVFCHSGKGVKCCNSENISLPVPCNGDRIVRIFFKGQSKSFHKAFVQIAGYYRK